MRNQLSGIGVVGLGYWGPNWVRNLHQLHCSEKLVACDLDSLRREHVEHLYPGVVGTANFEVLLEDPEIEGIVIATPVSLHYSMAKAALLAGKSVLVEKPLTASSVEAAELVMLARERTRVLMVGHTFEYSAPVIKLRDLIESGELGEIFYISSIRANLGLFQPDINVAWDLASHDISIVLMLMGGRLMPETVSCQGQGHYRRGIEDVAMLTLRFASNLIVFIHVSWLDPNKIRRTTIVGSKKMAVYDDTALQEKIRIYNKGVDVHPYYDTYGEFQLAYRYGDITIPQLRESEPLKTECEHFIDCIINGHTPRTDGLSGLRVVSVLEAADISLQSCGASVRPKWPEV